MKEKTTIELDDFNTKIYANLVPQVDKIFRHCNQGSIKTRYRYRDGVYHFCKFLNVINQFMDMYPNITVEVLHNNGAVLK